MLVIKLYILPYVGGTGTSLTTSSPSLNLGYVTLKYFSPPFDFLQSRCIFSLKCRLASACLKCQIYKNVLAASNRTNNFGQKP